MHQNFSIYHSTNLKTIYRTNSRASHRTLSHTLERVIYSFSGFREENVWSKPCRETRVQCEGQKRRLTDARTESRRALQGKDCRRLQATIPQQYSTWTSLVTKGPSFTENSTFLIHKLRRRQWHPTPVLLPGKYQGRGSLVGCGPWGR